MRKELIISMAFVATSFMYCSKPSDPPNQNPGPDPNPGGGGGNPGTTLAITTVSPDRSENTTVTITGTGFHSTADNNQVTFNSLVATVQTASTTQLVVNLPADITAGDYTVTVTTGGKSASKTNGFHFIDWVVSDWAGTGDQGTVNGPIATARFTQPRCMTADAAGNLYVVDLHLIRKITPQGVVSTYAGTGARGSANGPANAATFNFPNGLAIDKAGNLYVADGFNHMIRKITPAGDVTTIAGNTTADYRDDVGTAAAFSNPYGIVPDADEKNLIIGDHANHRLRKLNLASGAVTTLAGNGTQTSTNGKDLAAGIPWPGGLLGDATGNLYITEKGAGKVRKMDAAGNITTIGGFLAVNDSPVQMVLDEAGNLYVVFKGLDKIKKYTPAGVASDFAGGNISGHLNGPAKTASFLRPEGIILVKDNQGKLIFYIADSDNRRIRKITKE